MADAAHSRHDQDSQASRASALDDATCGSGSTGSSSAGLGAPVSAADELCGGDRSTPDAARARSARQRSGRQRAPTGDSTGARDSPFSQGQMSTASRDSGTGLPDEPASWGVDDVLMWLASSPVRLERYADAFARHKVDGLTLMSLTQDDVMGHLGVSVLGHAKRILHHARLLAERHGQAAIDAQRGVRMAMGAVAHARDPRIPSALRVSVLDSDVGRGIQRSRSFSMEPTTPGATPVGGSFSSAGSVGLPAEWMSPEDMPEFSLSLMFRALFAAAYFVFSIMCTSAVMVFVHERVPDQGKYPPLPDLFLDNIPLIPVAFSLTEVIAVTLFVMLLVVVCLHKHRLIILRRGLSITGSIFLLRCLTMMATSLSVPSTHLRCEAQSFGDTFEEKMARAWEIGSHFGLTIAGVQTCGDYMFSGHSVAVTMLNFLITEYTPYKGLHIFTWALNLFGLFFVLAAHEHHTVDVLVAFYISSRMFMYYHSLANLNALSDHNTATWYPMFSYLEEDVCGVVPNELGWPWARLRDCLEERRKAMAKQRRRVRKPKNKMEAALAALRHENQRLRRIQSRRGTSTGDKQGRHTARRGQHDKGSLAGASGSGSDGDGEVSAHTGTPERSTLRRRRTVGVLDSSRARGRRGKRGSGELRRVQEGLGLGAGGSEATTRDSDVTRTRSEAAMRGPRASARGGRGRDHGDRDAPAVGLDLSDVDVDADAGAAISERDAGTASEGDM